METTAAVAGSETDAEGIGMFTANGVDAIMKTLRGTQDGTRAGIRSQISEA